MTTLLSASPPNHKGRAFIHMPTVLAYLAGVALTLASAATNVRYALAKADGDPAMQAIWCTVAVAASVALALAPSAIMASLARRQFGSAALALVAALIFGAYSVTAALGAATGGRLVAEIEAGDVADKRRDARAALTKAEGELAAIGIVRPVEALDADIARLEASRRDLDPTGKGVCVGWLPNTDARRTCVAISEARAERAKAQRRAELEAAIAEARGVLASSSAGRTVANADAVALKGFADALGMPVSTDTLNRLLVILAVLVIELGGGLCFALVPAEVVSARDGHEQGGQAGGQTGGQTSGAVSQLHGPLPSAPVRAVEPVGQTLPAAEPIALPSVPSPETAETPAERASGAPVVVAAVPECPTRDASPEAAVLAVLRARGGSVLASQRSMAELFGLSRSTVNRTLHDMAAAGTVRMVATARGTAVSLNDGDAHALH